MKYCSAGGNMSDVFNVCTGLGTNIIDLAEEIAVSLQERPVIQFGPPRPGDPRRSIGRPDKAYRLLGFRALTTLMSGLERIRPEKVSLNKTVWQACWAGALAPTLNCARPQSSTAKV
jgi:nucleoside-diphosphate-sugar epimerase